MIDLSTQMTAARMITRDGPAKFLVWVTRAGHTVVVDVEARNAEEAKRKVAAELLEAERLLSAI